MYFIIILFLPHLIILLGFLYGTMKFSPSKSIISQNEGISIIVAVRNGELSLKQIINNLKNQDYKGSIEFLLIDDESTDNTKQIILNTASEDNRFKYYSSSAGSKLLKHKKKALDVGISNASYNYLLLDPWILTLYVLCRA